MAKPAQIEGSLLNHGGDDGPSARPRSRPCRRSSAAWGCRVRWAIGDTPTVPTTAGVRASTTHPLAAVEAAAVTISAKHLPVVRTIEIFFVVISLSLSSNSSSARSSTGWTTESRTMSVRTRSPRPRQAGLLHFTGHDPPGSRKFFVALFCGRMPEIAYRKLATDSQNLRERKRRRRQALPPVPGET